MWHIIIRKHNGEHVREESDSKPDTHDIGYWENYHADSVKVGKDYGLYDVYDKIPAIVINVYETEN